MRNCVRVRLTNSRNPTDIHELDSITSAARFVGVGVQSFTTALSHRVGERRLYREWWIERLNDLPRRRTLMWELQDQAHLTAFAEAEQIVGHRLFQGDPDLNDGNVDAAIAREFLHRYATYFAAAMIEELQWQAGRTLARKQPKKSTDAIASDEFKPTVRQRQRPPRQ